MSLGPISVLAIPAEVQEQVLCNSYWNPLFFNSGICTLAPHLHAADFLGGLVTFMGN